jgi:hypothetical protein
MLLPFGDAAAPSLFREQIYSVAAAFTCRSNLVSFPLSLHGMGLSRELHVVFVSDPHLPAEVFAFVFSMHLLYLILIQSGWG